ncbi:hypothetical protein GCM10023169_11650 [Georgenia halophila]|uniref:ChbG/HpnK family deacetylase n=1 Tax=Georgenia halophila TaxID=620889 RepID=A0ABP8KUN5_9MICO
MTRQLVITADDLARDPASDVVVLDLLGDSSVTATTLIPVSPHAGVAARRARELDVQPRLHLTLTSERGRPPWRALSGVSSLTGPDGALTDDPHVLAERAQTADVVAELEAQLGWMHAHDLRPAAADSHAGTLYGLHGRSDGSWLAETLAWCARNQLAFRLPRDAEPYMGRLPPELAERHAAAVALADDLGVRLPDVILTNRRAAQDLGSYETLCTDLLARLETLPEGVSELFLHPADDRRTAADGRDEGTPDRLRAWEARLLRDPVWRETLDRSGIELVGGWWS